MANRTNRRYRRNAERAAAGRPVTNDYRPSNAEIEQVKQENSSALLEANARLQRLSGATVSRIDREVVVDIPDVEPINVKINGEVYVCYPPKIATLMDAMGLSEDDKATDADAVESLYKWVELAFGEEDANAILDRIEDPRDTLDVVHIGQIMQAVMEKDTGNPTM